MYQLGDVYMRLSHITMVGAVQKVPGRPSNISAFKIQFAGNHFHEVLFDSAEDAHKAHALLIAALQQADDA